MNTQNLKLNNQDKINPWLTLINDWAKNNQELLVFVDSKTFATAFYLFQLLEEQVEDGEEVFENCFLNIEEEGAIVYELFYGDKKVTFYIEENNVEYFISKGKVITNESPVNFLPDLERKIPKVCNWLKEIE